MTRALIAVCLLLLAVAVAIARRTPPARGAARTPATASDALGGPGSTEAADLDRTTLVREALSVEPGLSPVARLTRVATTRGHVTLTGTVRSQRERAQILTMTLEIAGGGNVTSQLELDPSGRSLSWW